VSAGKTVQDLWLDVPGHVVGPHGQLYLVRRPGAT